MVKLLICDKDGTLVTPASGERFVQHPDDQILLQGVAEAIGTYKKQGWRVAIATNQGGVAAGYKSCYDMLKEVSYAMELVRANAAIIAHSYEEVYAEAWYLRAPNHSWKIRENLDTAVRFRKPNPGMIFRLCEEFAHPGNPIEDVLFVGDRPEDSLAANAAGVPFQWADEWRLGSQSEAPGY